MVGIGSVSGLASSFPADLAFDLPWAVCVRVKQAECKEQLNFSSLAHGETLLRGDGYLCKVLSSQPSLHSLQS